MKNWEDDDGTPLCTAKEDFMDAAKVADQLNIKLHHINFSKNIGARFLINF
jgi:tRNA-specific 2-thiouridylase